MQKTEMKKLTQEEHENLFGVTEKHPSYGMIGIYHRTGLHEHLFGSVVKQHNNVISIQVTEGEVNHNLSEDRFRGGKLILEIVMSASQFAEFITTPNMGSGVPCTIERMRDGKKLLSIEPPPKRPIESVKIKDEFENKLKKLVRTLEIQRYNLAKILERKSPNKAERREALGIIDAAIREVSSNAPFVVDQFQRAAEKIVSTAKAEVDNFVTRMIHRTGLKELQKVSLAIEEQSRKELPAHDDDEVDA